MGMSLDVQKLEIWNFGKMTTSVWHFCKYLLSDWRIVSKFLCNLGHGILKVISLCIRTRHLMDPREWKFQYTSKNKHHFDSIWPFIRHFGRFSIYLPPKFQKILRQKFQYTFRKSKNSFRKFKILSEASITPSEISIYLQILYRKTFRQT